MRLHYFDMLKGIAIFMVVMGHVLTMCIRGIDSAFAFKLIGLVHMPLFFFISGYFSGRRDPDGRLRMPNLAKRALQLLVPMVVVSTAWIYYYPHSGLQSPFNSTWAGLWGDVWKNGYWFTLTLYIIIALLAALVPLLSRLRSAAARVAVTVAVAAGLFVADAFVPEVVGAAVELPFVARFFPVFMAGVWAAGRREAFDRIAASSAWVTGALIVGSTAAYYAMYPWDFPELPAVAGDCCHIVIHLCLVVVAVAVVKPWSERQWVDGATQPSRAARLWSCLGENSLGIYLLHYFFLFPLTFMQQPLRDMGLGMTPTLLVAAAGAAAVVAVTMAVVTVLRHSRPLSLLILGR